MCKTDDKNEQRRRLNKWIKYHTHIVTILAELDEFSKGSIGTLSLAVSIVCAVTVNQVLKGEKTIAGLATGIGWFYSFIINCITGQRVINLTDSITTNIVCSKWYTVDIRLKKDIGFVLFRTQRPFTLNALPLGTLNMELLLM
uniref:Uncharacterized protein LOC114336775 n=1 Tax=Diabrotica virgifera virgifera TaxID=50390 RepID=A0A6P7GDF5_DIAVI